MKRVISIGIDEDLATILSGMNNKSQFVQDAVKNELRRQGKIQSTTTEINLELNRDVLAVLDEVARSHDCSTIQEFIERVLVTALSIIGKNPTDKITPIVLRMQKAEQLKR